MTSYALSIVPNSIVVLRPTSFVQHSYIVLNSFFVLPPLAGVELAFDTSFWMLNSSRRSTHSRKEVFQPHLPVRLPCYDLAPVTCCTLGRSLRSRTSGTPSFHGLTGGVYKARERIHRAMADARLLANPASWSRVAGSNPN